MVFKRASFAALLLLLLVVASVECKFSSSVHLLLTCKQEGFLVDGQLTENIGENENNQFCSSSSSTSFACCNSDEIQVKWSVGAHSLTLDSSCGGEAGKKNEKSDEIVVIVTNSGRIIEKGSSKGETFVSITPQDIESSAAEKSSSSSSSSSTNSLSSFSVSILKKGKAIATQSIDLCPRKSAVSSLANTKKSTIQFDWPLEGMEVPPTMQILEITVNDVEISADGNNLYINIDGTTHTSSSQTTRLPLPPPSSSSSSGLKKIEVSIVDSEGEIISESSLSYLQAPLPSTPYSFTNFDSENLSRFSFGYFSFEPKYLTNDPFPHLLMPKLLDPIFYEALKKTFPGEEWLGEPTQLGKRRNLQLGDENFTKWMEGKVEWQRLVNFMASGEYVNFVDMIFPDSLKNQYGYLGQGAQSLSFDISVGSTEYWTPIHTDSRGRIAVFLLYFGMDDIESGGDICLLKHKKRDRWVDYPQFPNVNDIEERACFPPIDNFGLVFLNTPDSYHWPKQVVGRRRFLYVGLNAKVVPAWESGEEFKSFKHGIEVQTGLKEWAEKEM